MKKRNLLTLALAAALTLSMSACGNSAQTETKLKGDILESKTEVDTFRVHLKETDKGERFFVTINGIVYSREDYIKAIEQAGFDPNTIATLAFDVAQGYRAAPDARNTTKPADDDTFYHNKAGADITYGQYKKLIRAFRPTEIEALDSELIDELCSEELDEPTLETNGKETVRNTTKLSDKRIVFLSYAKCYDETNGGKLSVSLEAGNRQSATAFCEITRDGKRETKLFDENSDELKAEGNKLTLELDEGEFDLADFGIIAVCDK